VIGLDPAPPILRPPVIDDLGYHYRVSALSRWPNCITISSTRAASPPPMGLADLGYEPTNAVMASMASACPQPAQAAITQGRRDLLLLSLVFPAQVGKSSDDLFG